MYCSLLCLALALPIALPITVAALPALPALAAPHNPTLPTTHTRHHRDPDLQRPLQRGAVQGERGLQGDGMRGVMWPGRRAGLKLIDVRTSNQMYEGECWRSESSRKWGRNGWKETKQGSPRWCGQNPWGVKLGEKWAMRSMDID
ncbi:hypothetical protein DFH09DRAFT_1092459 [Mycena vulgaris]|nr:hypothetical protein DFH09DRAFT_1092459 [Mycena vulgaris]